MQQLDLFPEIKTSPIRQERGTAATQGLEAIDGSKPNEHGVFSNEHAESFILPDKRKGWLGVPRAAVYYLQLNNGNWISTYEYFLPDRGSSSGLSIHSSQFAGTYAKTGAIKHALLEIKRGVEQHTKYPEYLKWVNEITAKMNYIEQTDYDNWRNAI